MQHNPLAWKFWFSARKCDEREACVQDQFNAKHDRFDEYFRLTIDDIAWIRRTCNVSTCGEDALN